MSIFGLLSWVLWGTSAGPLDFRREEVMAGEAMLLILVLELEPLRTMERLLATRSIADCPDSLPAKEWSLVGLELRTFFRRLFHFSENSFLGLLPDTEVRLMSLESSRLIDFLTPTNEPMPVPVFLLRPLETAGLRTRLQQEPAARLGGVGFLEAPSDDRPLDDPGRYFGL